MDRSRPVVIVVVGLPLYFLIEGILAFGNKAANYKIGPPTVYNDLSINIWMPGCSVSFLCGHDHLGDRHICAEQQRISFHEKHWKYQVLSICKVEAHTINQNFVPIFYIVFFRPYHQWPLLIMGTPVASSGGFHRVGVEFDFNQIRSDLVSLWKIYYCLWRKNKPAHQKE